MIFVKLHSPVWKVTRRLTEAAESKDVVYAIVIFVLKLTLRALRVKFDIRGEDQIPKHGAAVIVCNHIGYLDFAFVGLIAAKRRRVIRFMAKKGIFENPILGPLMRAMRHIAVDRTAGTATVRQAQRLLRSGELVGVFPEATISRAWTLKPFQPGAVALAISQKVTLIPVITWGGHRLITVDRHRSARPRVPVIIWVGTPIAPVEEWNVHGRKARAETVLKVQEDLRRQMQELLEIAQRCYPDKPRDDADRWWLPQYLGGAAPNPEEAAAIDQAKMLD